MPKTTEVKNSAYRHSASAVAVSPLFSGSRGNCTLIQSGNVNILLDAGVSCRSILSALADKGLAQRDISAIIVTHEHGDHIAALTAWSKTCPTPIYAPAQIADYVRMRAPFSCVYEIDGSFQIGDVTVDVFECSHDAMCCCGYRFSAGGGSFACVTDTGCPTDELIQFLSPCSAVMLESNHDVDMLKVGPYPQSLKQRILSDYGHLSNAQTAQVVQKLANSRVKTIILAHLSETNNTKELAFAATVQAMAACGLVEGKDITVFVADQYKNEVTVCAD